MKFVYIVVLILTSTHTLANEPVYESWKTFQSDYGFEFKYPACWKIVSDDIDNDDTVPLSRHAGIFVKEAGACLTVKKHKYMDNGIVFSASRNRTDKEFMRTEMEDLQNSARYQLKSKNWLAFKKIKIDGNTDVVLYVEKFLNKVENYLRWRYIVYCPSRRISITGPAIDSPNKSLLGKLEQGDLAIPEPHRTIFYSFRCADVKVRLPNSINVWRGK